MATVKQFCIVFALFQMLVVVGGDYANYIEAVSETVMDLIERIPEIRHCADKDNALHNFQYCMKDVVAYKRKPKNGAHDTSVTTDEPEKNYYEEDKEYGQGMEHGKDEQNHEDKEYEEDEHQGDDEDIYEENEGNEEEEKDEGDEESKDEEMDEGDEESKDEEMDEGDEESKDEEMDKGDKESKDEEMDEGDEESKDEETEEKSENEKEDDEKTEDSEEKGEAGDEEEGEEKQGDEEKAEEDKESTDEKKKKRKRNVGGIMQKAVRNKRRKRSQPNLLINMMQSNNLCSVFKVEAECINGLSNELTCDRIEEMNEYIKNKVFYDFAVWQYHVYNTLCPEKKASWVVMEITEKGSFTNWCYLQLFKMALLCRNDFFISQAKAEKPTCQNLQNLSTCSMDEEKILIDPAGNECIWSTISDLYQAHELTISKEIYPECFEGDYEGLPPRSEDEIAEFNPREIKNMTMFGDEASMIFETDIVNRVLFMLLSVTAYFFN